VTAAKKSFASESRDGPVHRLPLPERIVMPKKKSSSKSRTSNVYKATKRTTRKSTAVAQPTTHTTVPPKPSTPAPVAPAPVPNATMAAAKETSPATAPLAKAASAQITSMNGPKKLSALDAAAKILREMGTPMSVKQLIETMAQRGLWTSPGGKTPSATLYSSITREITTKGSAARFQKTDRGRFKFHE